MTQITTLSDLIEAAQLLPCPIERHRRDHQLMSKYLETLRPEDYPRDPDKLCQKLSADQAIIILQSGKKLRFVIYRDRVSEPTWMLAGRSRYVHIEASDIKGV